MNRSGLNCVQTTQSWCLLNYVQTTQALCLLHRCPSHHHECLQSTSWTPSLSQTSRSYVSPIQSPTIKQIPVNKRTQYSFASLFSNCTLVIPSIPSVLCSINDFIAPNSHYTVLLRYHPFHIQPFLLHPHFRPAFLWQLQCLVEHRVVLKQSAKIWHHMSLKRLYKWQTTLCAPAMHQFLQPPALHSTLLHQHSFHQVLQTFQMILVVQQLTGVNFHNYSHQIFHATTVIARPHEASPHFQQQVRFHCKMWAENASSTQSSSSENFLQNALHQCDTY